MKAITMVEELDLQEGNRQRPVGDSHPAGPFSLPFPT